VQAQETGIFFVVGGAVAAAERNFLGMQAYWPPPPAVHSLSLSQHLLVNETKHGLRPSAQVLAVTETAMVVATKTKRAKKTTEERAMEQLLLGCLRAPDARILFGWRDDGSG